MSDHQQILNQTEVTSCTNVADVVNMESSRQSPEITHINIPRNHTSNSLTLGRFDMELSRTLRNSTSLAENISSTIEGFRPLVERVRSHPRLSSWLNIQRQRQEPPSSPVSDSYIIHLDEPLANNTMVSQRSAHDERHCQRHSRRTVDGFLNDNVNNESNDINANTRVDGNVNDDNNSNNNSSNTGNSNINIVINNNANGTNNSGSAAGNDDTNIMEENTANEPQEIPISPETRALLIVLKRYVPYVLILLVKVVYDHSIGILNLLFLLGTFLRANADLKREIIKQQNRSWFTLVRILFQILGCFLVVTFVFGEKIFVIFYEDPGTMWELLWSVAIMDFTIKLITVALKVLLTCLPISFLAIPKRGKYYLMVEATSQLYRCGAPIKPWLYYLFDAYQGPQKILGIVLSIAYAISKISDIVPKINLFRKAVCKLLQNLSLGVAPSKEQVVASGGICAICHEEYTTPVRLRCKHIFCESCVSVWLDRERSCPLCRAAITDDPAYRDGHTSYFVQLY